MEIQNLVKSSKKIKRGKFFTWLGAGYVGMMSLQTLVAELFMKKTKLSEISHNKINVKINPNAVSRKNKV